MYVYIYIYIIYIGYHRDALCFCGQCTLCLGKRAAKQSQPVVLLKGQMVSVPGRPKTYVKQYKSGCKPGCPKEPATTQQSSSELIDYVCAAGFSRGLLNEVRLGCRLLPGLRQILRPALRWCGPSSPKWASRECWRL